MKFGGVNVCLRFECLTVAKVSAICADLHGEEGAGYAIGGRRLDHKRGGADFMQFALGWSNAMLCVPFCHLALLKSGSCS